MKRSIEVTVSAVGEISIDAMGFKGPDCELATQFLEEALGIISAKVKKPEFHQQQAHRQQQRLG